MKPLALLQSAPILTPLGYVFGLVALGACVLLVKLWLSVSNTERIAMERLLKQAKKDLEKERSERLNVGLKADKLAKEKRDLEQKIREQNKRLEKVEAANEVLRATEQKQSMLISTLTDRCDRNEKLIMKLYADLGKDIDLRFIGGDPSTDKPPVGTSK